jgi:pyruvate/2-oxoglutarate dehydrogenase complex dihydrolipoamide acyltransferase (E2) component
MQLQEDLASARGGGGANRDDLARIDQQIAQADRVLQGTRAAMEDAGCFESFFIFGRGLVRSPKCLNMNNRVEDARRQLTQLQQQRQALSGGGGNRRRQAELQDALARSGCGGQPPAQKRRGGGLFDFFGGGQDDEPEPQTPVYRSIDPNGRYRSVCVRLCDGFFYPIHYSTYGSLLGADAQSCQSNCAAPAELYVYRNPGQEIEQAVSLNGSAYMDLPVALRYRKEYVQGCSCKQAEYNPTEIEAANKRAEADTAQPTKGKGKATAKAPAPPPPAAQAAAPAGQTADVEMTGSNPPAVAPVQAPAAQKPPAPPVAAAAPPPAAPAASASAAPPAQGQSTIIKKAPKPPAPPAQ